MHISAQIKDKIFSVWTRLQHTVQVEILARIKLSILSYKLGIQF